ncbi:MAG: hypothetical protein KA761_00125 [Gemmatimonadaceae bacterium]|nr:hypothetical protein [Gemmatimonadaceae bacterium]
MDVVGPYYDEDLGWMLRKKAAAAMTIGFDLIEWLNGDTISGSAWAISGPDSALTKSNEGISTDGTQATVRLSGGTAGKEYVVVNTVTLASGDVEPWRMTVIVGNP